MTYNFKELFKCAFSVIRCVMSVRLPTEYQKTSEQNNSTKYIKKEFENVICHKQFNASEYVWVTKVLGTAV